MKYTCHGCEPSCVIECYEEPVFCVLSLDSLDCMWVPVEEKTDLPDDFWGKLPRAIRYLKEAAERGEELQSQLCLCLDLLRRCS